jgi:hypothetical protein
MRRQIAKTLRALKPRRGFLSILGVASIVVAGFSVALWLGYTLAGIGLWTIDEMLFGSDHANVRRRNPKQG